MSIALTLLAIAGALLPIAQRPRRPAGPPPVPTLLINSLDVLNEPAAKKDLGLSAEQAKKVDIAIRRQRDVQRGIDAMPETEDPIADRRERERQTLQLYRNAEETVSKILQPNQTKRFKQILMQTFGPRAFGNPDIAAALELTGNQSQAIRHINDVHDEKYQRLGQGLEGATAAEREKLLKKLSDLDKERDRDIVAELSDKQRKQWNEMTGKPLK